MHAHCMLSPQPPHPPNIHTPQASSTHASQQQPAPTLGSATLASQRRPSMVCSAASAAAAAPGSIKLTKPKPRLLPLKRSFITSAASTLPKRLKCARSVSSLRGESEWGKGRRVLGEASMHAWRPQGVLHCCFRPGQPAIPPAKHQPPSHLVSQGSPRMASLRGASSQPSSELLPLLKGEDSGRCSPACDAAAAAAAATADAKACSWPAVVGKVACCCCSVQSSPWLLLQAVMMSEGECGGDSTGDEPLAHSG